MVFEFLFARPLLFHSIIVLISLFILYKAADYLVDGISGYAKKLGLSDAIIGLLVVAMAASAPEIVSSLTGFMSGQGSVGFGAILGANMVHVGFALGILAVLGRKISIEAGIFSKQKLMMWVALMLPLFLVFIDVVENSLFGGNTFVGLSRFDGFILLVVFSLYIKHLWKIEGTLGKIKKKIKLKNIWRDVFIFLGCLAAILIAGILLVGSSVKIAKAFNIPSYFIALTIIGAGATLPDLAVELRSVFKKHAGIGLGNLLGSLAIEFILFFGILAVINPLRVDFNTVANAFFFLAVGITTLMLIMRGKYLTWKHGLIFLGLYAAFIAIEIAKIV